MNIIGINGFKRSGKGETGNHIEKLVLGVKQLGFADKLKVFAARSLGYINLSDADCIKLMDDAKEAWVMDIARVELRPDSAAVDSRQGFTEPPVRTYLKQWTVRQLLQYMGTEARTVFGEDFWVDQVLPKPISARDQYLGSPTAAELVKTMYPDASVLAFTDLRFENEAERIIALGGFNIEVVRPGVKSDGHASELVLPRHLIKYQIVNDRGLDELGWEVNKVMELEGLTV